MSSFQGLEIIYYKRGLAGVLWYGINEKTTAAVTFDSCIMSLVESAVVQQLFIVVCPVDFDISSGRPLIDAASSSIVTQPGPTIPRTKKLCIITLI